MSESNWHFVSGNKYVWLEACKWNFEEGIFIIDKSVRHWVKVIYVRLGEGNGCSYGNGVVFKRMFCMIIYINLKIREELDKTDESLAKKKDEFIKNINLFKLQIAKNIDNGIINYSELLIKKISSEEPNKNSLVEIFNKIKA